MSHGAQGSVPRGDALRAAWWTVTSCTLNAFTYECTVRYDRSAGQFISFVQVVVVAMMTTPRALRDLLGRRRARQTPSVYTRGRRIKLLLLLLLYFLTFYGTVFLINLSVQLGVSLQLVHLFRAGTLVAALIFATLFERKRYTLYQYASVFAVTIGLAWATLALQDSKPVGQSLWAGVRASPAHWLGVLLLVVNCFLSPAMGMLQQVLLVPTRDSSKGALSKTELVCLQHWVAVLVFLMPSYKPGRGYLGAHARGLWHAAVPLSSGRGSTSGKLLITVNALSQYFCMQGVVQMHITSRSVLFVQLVTALRKMLSVLVSAQLFGTSLRNFDWASVLFVFGGTLGYFLGHGRASNPKNDHSQQKKKLCL